MAERHSQEVWVTGFGIRTAFGEGPGRVLETVFCGRHGFAPVARFPTRAYRQNMAAIDPTAQSELAAAKTCCEQALRAARLVSPEVDAVFWATSGDHDWLERRLSPAGQPAFSEHAQCLPSYFADRLGRELGISGLCLAFNNACVAASSALGYAFDLLARGRLKRVLVGGSSLVSEEFFAKFDSGRAFSQDGMVRAFSTERTGLLLGDAVGALILENCESVAERGASALCQFESWGFGSDAHHVCQPHPSGAGLARAIGDALQRAEITAEHISYVNAHGTGTLLNDLSEARALHTALGPAAVDIPVSSSKTSLGHGLEAAGAVEAIVTILALSSGKIPPNVGMIAPDPACHLNVVTEPQSRPLERALSLNSAFGGVNTALLFRRVLRETPEAMHVI